MIIAQERAIITYLEFKLKLFYSCRNDVRRSFINRNSYVFLLKHVDNFKVAFRKPKI